MTVRRAWPSIVAKGRGPSTPVLQGWHIPDFMDQGLCRETDADLWFPDHDGATVGVNAAKRVCGKCPVRLECLQYALDTEERYGVWGGLSARDRKKLKRRKAS